MCPPTSNLGGNQPNQRIDRYRHIGHATGREECMSFFWNCDPKVGLVPAILLFAIVSLVYMYTANELIKINNSLGAKRNIGRGIIHTNNDYARMCYIVFFPSPPSFPGFGQAWLLFIQLHASSDLLRRLHRHHDRDDGLHGVASHPVLLVQREALHHANPAHHRGHPPLPPQRPGRAGPDLLVRSAGADRELRASLHLLLRLRLVPLAAGLPGAALLQGLSQQFRRLRLLPRHHAAPLHPARWLRPSRQA